MVNPSILRLSVNPHPRDRRACLPVSSHYNISTPGGTRTLTLSDWRLKPAWLPIPPPRHKKTWDYSLDVKAFEALFILLLSRNFWSLLWQCWLFKWTTLRATCIGLLSSYSPLFKLAGLICTCGTISLSKESFLTCGLKWHWTTQYYVSIFRP